MYIKQSSTYTYTKEPSTHLQDKPTNYFTMERKLVYILQMLT